MKFNKCDFFILPHTHRVTPPNLAYSFLNTIRYHFSDDEIIPNGICSDHDHELLKPQLISTWMPNGVGAMPGRRVIFAETQVKNYLFFLCY